MKKIGKLSLHNLSQTEITKKEMNTLKGGQNCNCRCFENPCPCKYAGTQEGPNDSFYGGSSVDSNHDANNGNGNMFYALHESKINSGGNYYT